MGDGGGRLFGGDRDKTLAARRILVNYAIARGAGKRGGSARKVSLEDVMIASPGHDVQIVELDDALRVFPPVEAGHLDHQRQVRGDLRISGQDLGDVRVRQLPLTPERIKSELKKG